MIIDAITTPFESRVTMWVTVCLNALIVASLGVTLASGIQEDDAVKRYAAIVLAIALTSVSNWLLHGFTWHKVCTQHKHEAWAKYTDLVDKANTKIAAVNAMIEKVNTERDEKIVAAKRDRDNARSEAANAQTQLQQTNEINSVLRFYWQSSVSIRHMPATVDWRSEIDQLNNTCDAQIRRIRLGKATT